MRQTTVLAFLILLSGTSQSPAQDPQPKSAEKQAPADSGQASPEFAAIRAGSEAFVTAFGKADAQTLAALWVEDGEYVDETGRVFAGRDAIREIYAQFFAENPHAQIHIQIDSLRQLSPDAVIEDGRAVVALGPAGPASSSGYTAVHVKKDGQWLMASVRDLPSETALARQNAADLRWLVGTWVAEEQGVKTESICNWVADKSFLERKHTTTRPDGTTISGVQLIGWNPLGRHVQSWNFTSDGGFSVGIWTPIDGGWRANVSGTTGDGVPTAAVNILRRLDDNAYAWQSVQRFLGDAALPDTDEIVIKRQPAAK
jgi:uncharacterized protein (TIGR02246 family)